MFKDNNEYLKEIVQKLGVLADDDEFKFSGQFKSDNEYWKEINKLLGVIVENGGGGGSAELPFHFFKLFTSEVYLDEEGNSEIQVIVYDGNNNRNWFICPKGFEYIYAYSEQSSQMVRALLVDGKTEYTEDDFEEFGGGVIAPLELLVDGEPVTLGNEDYVSIDFYYLSTELSSKIFSIYYELGVWDDKNTNINPSDMKNYLEKGKYTMLLNITINDVTYTNEESERGSIIEINNPNHVVINLDPFKQE